VLSVGILIGFQYLYAKFFPVPPPLLRRRRNNCAIDTDAGSRRARTEWAPAPELLHPHRRADAANPGGGDRRREAGAHRYARLHGSIALNGGRIDDLTSPIIMTRSIPRARGRALVAERDQGFLFRGIGWVPGTEGVKVPGPDTQWTAAGGPLTPDSPVTSAGTMAPASYSPAPSARQNYMFTVRDAVKNAGSAPVSLLPYA